MNLVIALKNAESVEQMQGIIAIHSHDHRIGFPWCKGGPLICLAEDVPPTYEAVVATQPYEQRIALSNGKVEEPSGGAAAQVGDLDAVKGASNPTGRARDTDSVGIAAKCGTLVENALNGSNYKMVWGTWRR